MGIREDLLLCYKGMCTEYFIDRYFYSYNVMLPPLSAKKDSYNFIPDEDETFCPLSIFLLNGYALLLALNLLRQIYVPFLPLFFSKLLLTFYLI